MQVMYRKGYLAEVLKYPCEGESAIECKGSVEFSFGANIHI